MKSENHLLPHLRTKMLFILFCTGALFVILFSLKLRETTISWFHFVSGCIIFGTVPIFRVHSNSVEHSYRWQPFTARWSRIGSRVQQVILVALIMIGVMTSMLTFIWLFPDSEVAFYSLLLGAVLTQSTLSLIFLILRVLQGRQ